MPTQWWQRRGVVRASCPLCKQIFLEDFDLGAPGADFRDSYDDAAKKGAGARGGSYVVRAHRGVLGTVVVPVG